MRYISNDRVLSISSIEYNNAPWLSEKNIRYYASGREALVSLIDALSVENRVVLLPAYVPQGLYAPFQKRNWKILLYPIDRKLAPIWSEVELLIKKYSPSIAILIHYFGTTQPIKKFVEICHKNKIRVIEDYAHTIPNRDNLAYQGDYILYSLPKMIGVVDGAVLIIRDLNMDIDLLKYNNKRTNHIYITKQFCLLALNSTISKIPNAKIVNILSAIFGKLFNSYANLMSIYHNPNKISKISANIIKRTNFDEMVKIRSRYTKMYDEQLNWNYFGKLSYLDREKKASFGYPVLVPDRESFYKYLAKKGIYGVYLVSNWDYIPKEYRGTKLFEQTEYIINHHFIFPTASHLKKKDIEYIIECANKWATGRGN